MRGRLKDKNFSSECRGVLFHVLAIQQENEPLSSSQFYITRSGDICNRVSVDRFQASMSH